MYKLKHYKKNRKGSTKWIENQLAAETFDVSSSVPLEDVVDWTAAKDSRRLERTGASSPFLVSTVLFREFLEIQFVDGWIYAPLWEASFDSEGEVTFELFCRTVFKTGCSGLFAFVLVRFRVVRVSDFSVVSETASSIELVLFTIVARDTVSSSELPIPSKVWLASLNVCDRGSNVSSFWILLAGLSVKHASCCLFLFTPTIPSSPDFVEIAVLLFDFIFCNDTLCVFIPGKTVVTSAAFASTLCVFLRCYIKHFEQ